MADLKLSHLALRTAAGAFILNAGIGKWSGSEETAAGVHGMAVGTYPFLKAVPSRRFLKLLTPAGTSGTSSAVPKPISAAASSLRKRRDGTASRNG